MKTSHPSLSGCGARAARARVVRCALIGLLALLCLGLPARSQNAGVALLADIDGPIGPATSRFVTSTVEAATQRGALAIVLRMDTPGGLSESMREIIKTILSSPVPVLTYVAPSGARAASAGTYILYASHVAAMAPGTNLGAATPIKIGGGLPLPRPSPSKPPAGDGGGDGDDTPPKQAPPATDDASEMKMMNDAAAYIRGLAELRGRNVEWAEQSVRKADSLPVSEALAKGVIDLMAASVDELLASADGRTVDVQGNEVVLHTAGLTVEQHEMSWQTQLLSILTNPNIAFILLMVGVYGLIFEFSNPGSIGPGVIGVICLLLGLYALNLLPLDWTGVGLLLLGVAFMVAEAFTPTLGILGIAGLVAFVLGASLLLDSDSPHFRLSWQVIAGTGIASAVLLLLIVGFALRSQRRAVTTGDVELMRSPATVLEWDGDSGYIRVRGERWRARSKHPVEPGARVVVTGVHGLVVDVAPPNRIHTEDNS